MNFGLTDQEFDFLNKHLIQPLKSVGASVYIFGSRATGKQHKFSDIDLLYIENNSHPVDTKFISKILVFFEESHFPYKIDLVNSSKLAKSYTDRVNQEKILV